MRLNPSPTGCRRTSARTEEGQDGCGGMPCERRRRQEDRGGIVRLSKSSGMIRRVYLFVNPVGFVHPLQPTQAAVGSRALDPLALP